MALAGKGGPLTEKQQYYINRGYISTDRLIKLVNDMLNVSRIEAGRLSVVMAPVNLVTVVNDVIAEVQPRAQELGIHLVYTPSPTPLPNVSADADKIKQVLINLIGNSLKFTPKDGNITLSTYLQDNMVITSVADTGSGIAKEDFPKLFHKFGKLDDKEYLVKQNAQGTGLGLYITKSRIEIHHGKIWFTSGGEGKGATFFFSLPPVL